MCHCAPDEKDRENLRTEKAGDKEGTATSPTHHGEDAPSHGQNEELG